MIKVFFFAQTRELIGLDQLEITADVHTAEQLRQQLSLRGKQWALALNKEKLLVAINHTISSLDTPIQEGDEIAFFPPVTGG